VFWPEGTDAAPFMGRFDWVSALLAAAAFVSLSRFKIGIMPVLGVCAAIGLIYIQLTAV
jgi:chromate transporter